MYHYLDLSSRFFLFLLFRVLDCFFAEGVIVFYRVALSVMNILQDKILEVFFYFCFLLF